MSSTTALNNELVTDNFSIQGKIKRGINFAWCNIITRSIYKACRKVITVQISVTYSAHSSSTNTSIWALATAPMVLGTGLCGIWRNENFVRFNFIYRIISINNTSPSSKKLFFGVGGNLVWCPLCRHCIIFFVSLSSTTKSMPRV